MIPGTAPTRRLVLGAAAASLLPSVAPAQEPGRTYRVGGLITQPREVPHYVAFFDELRRFGFIEGKNLEVRGFGLRVDQYAALAAELVKAPVDAILATGDTAIRVAQRATPSIPILAVADDMVGSGLVRSMARPEGNTTGISLLATELNGKRQEILIEMLPEARRIAALADPSTATAQQLQALQDAARARGLDLTVHRITKPEEIAGAIDAAKRAGADALNVLASPLLNTHVKLILERVAALRLPAIYQWAEIGEQGGLAGYGPSIVQLWRDVFSRQLVRLLQGAKIVDVPIEQPTRFELVINLRTARAIGLNIPQSILARADRVIE